MGGRNNQYLVECAACERLFEDAIECRACGATQFVINRRDGGGLWVECSACGARFLLRETALGVEPLDDSPRSQAQKNEPADRMEADQKSRMLSRVLEGGEEL